ncbi:MAG TPA: DNA polymerase domain-containing protein [Candidatus Thermoplasmatota archaeon]|nr:DNA polymerase domain-containing protein [Candidatus Thermoplasmatota archaeon]
MRVPLAAHRVIANDTQFLDIWTNGKRERVAAPFRPYCYAAKPMNHPAARAEALTVRPLSTLEPASWWKLSFPTVQGVSEVSRGEAPLQMADNHVAFIERVLVDEPGFFPKFANTDALRMMVLDVEQLTSGKGFPTAKDPLIGIGWACGDGAAEVVLGDGKDDRSILAKFAEAVRAYDPDVFVGYNLQDYDLPMILRRMEANGMDATPLARSGVPRVEDDEDGVFLEGRLVFDVFDSVKLDQTLFGIKDRRLKTVAAWMNLPVIVEDTKDTRALVGTQRLADYNRNDVEITRSLSRIYFPNMVALAEFHSAPLNVLLRATPSFHTTVLQGRIFRRADPVIVSDGKNEDRYWSLYRESGGVAFVGGIVEIYRRGLFRPLWKVDFSSMYPSIMVTLGCGADNTRLVRTEAIGPFRVARSGETLTLHVPDESRGVSHVIEIRGESELASELRRLLATRMDLKRQAKVATAQEREGLHARQNALKVVLNSIYGVMASSFARYGSLPVAMATVGVARQLIRVVEDHLGDAKIETDTDGVYSAATVDPEAVNALVHGFVERDYGVDSHLRLDVDEYAAGYFHERKSYLLLHKDGRIEKHGIAFKGSSLCGVFDRTLDRVSRALLLESEDPKEAGRACFDLAAYEPKDFVMRVRLGKDVSEYKAGTPIGKQVAEAHERLHGRRPQRGEQLEYVKTSRGFEVPTDGPDGSMNRLDKEYYREIVAGVLDRLDIAWQPTTQRKLLEF